MRTYPLEIYLGIVLLVLSHVSCGNKEMSSDVSSKDVRKKISEENLYTIAVYHSIFSGNQALFGEIIESGLDASRPLGYMTGNEHIKLNALTLAALYENSDALELLKAKNPNLFDCRDENLDRPIDIILKEGNLKSDSFKRCLDVLRNNRSFDDVNLYEEVLVNVMRRIGSNNINLHAVHGYGPIAPWNEAVNELQNIQYNNSKNDSHTYSVVIFMEKLNDSEYNLKSSFVKKDDLETALKSNWFSGGVSGRIVLLHGYWITVAKSNWDG